ncbi:hypothetical protein BDW68DRAFT_148789 [Aspergillus falconensis]
MNPMNLYSLTLIFAASTMVIAHPSSTNQSHLYFPTSFSSSLTRTTTSQERLCFNLPNPAGQTLVMSQDPSQIVSINDLVKPGYHERLVVEIDRRDPDLMSLAIISRTLIAHSIEVVDLADKPAKSRGRESAGATNDCGGDNNDSSTEGRTTDTKTSNAARRKMNGDTDSGKKSGKSLCRKRSGSADWPQKEDKARGGVKARSKEMDRNIRETYFRCLSGGC